MSNRHRIPAPEAASARENDRKALCRSWMVRYGRRVTCNLPKPHDGSHRGYAPDAAVRWITTPNPDAGGPDA